MGKSLRHLRSRRSGRLLRLGILLGALALAPAAAHAFPPAHLSKPDGATSAPEPFPVPDSLRAAIYFWTQIFTRYTSAQVVLHDRDDLSTIWEMVPLPLDEDRAIDHHKARKRIDARTVELEARLKRLAKFGKATDEKDEVLLTLAGDAANLAGAWRRIRAQRGVADSFQRGLAQSEKWLPKIRAVLREERVPEELVALTFVETMFNPLARSSAGAGGLWQLMPATARQLGLRVDRKVDERLDVLKSSRAAAKMLRQSYEMLGGWPLAITGYNHGPYGMKRAVKLMGSTDLVYLIDHYEKATWGFASKNFYAEFLAALRLIQGSEGDKELALSSEPEANSDTHSRE